MYSLRDSLKQSAINRASMLEKFGFMPTSVLRDISRGGLSGKIFQYQGETPARQGRGAKAAEKQAKLRGILGRPIGDASNRTIGRGRASTSIMPAELVAFFVKYYAEPGDVYIDPFMGQGVQMQVARLLGLDYYGYDLSEEFYRYIAAIKEKIDDGATTISITHGDSRSPDVIPDGIADFSFHSPPYWDIEYYGEEAGQLGYKQSYPDFLAGMQDIARAWLPKFKPGAYHVVNVNDFRKDGIYYAYHADTIALFQRAGWILHDTWIIEGLVGGLSRAFAVDFNLKRIAPKFHEYALVFRAPAS
jgi:hypothetical protein